MNGITRRGALVTGASRGIGRAIAERLASPDLVVAVHYRSAEAEAMRAVETIRALGGEAFAVRADLAVPAELDVLFDGLTAGLREHTGDGGLDILINNAGVGCRGDVASVTADALHRAFAVNLWAPVFIVQRALPLLRPGGRIVNISSMATRVTHPDILGYAMSKGAIEVFTRALAKQLGPRGIRVNAVAPGLIDTDFHGDRLRRSPEEAAELAARAAMGRVGQVADVADIVAFLVSDSAGWVTGERIEASGGSWL